MLLKSIRYYSLMLIAIVYASLSYGQLGAPIINVDFGQGNADQNTVGPPLPTGVTGFSYSSSTCPPPGSYTIVRRINVNGCFNDEWILLSRNHTSDMDFGNVMLINSTAHFTPKPVYVDTVNQPLCVGTRYEFSVAIINVDRPSTCNPMPAFPVFALNIENIGGQVLFTDTTHGGVAYASPLRLPYKFNEYAIRFVMPPVAGPLVLRIILLPSSADCGEDFAIDDVLLSPVGPKAKVAFDNEPSSTIVKSVCFQDNRNVSMNGNMNSFYNNPSLQWQQSIDNGITWTDIPQATGNNYSRSFSVSDTFLFRLSGAEAANIANPVCRVVSNNIKVNVDGIPSDFNAINNSPVCAGQNLQFNATEGFAAYNWTGPNGFSETSPFPHIYNSSLADRGMYYVQIVTPGGCAATDSTYVTIIGTDVKTRADTSICNGSTVRLQASGGISYSWSPASTLSNPTVANPQATPNITTTYTVKVTDQFGCSNTGSTTVKLLNTIAVKAVIEGSNYICRPYDSASFKDMSQGKIVSWNWDFRNGQTSLLPNPPIQNYWIADNTTNYLVRLAVMDTVGCTDTAYHSIQVADNCYIAVPSAFTPNGDGLNDYLYPLNAYKATNLLLRIYNRHGQLLFETRDWTKKWDGTVRGMKQATDTFVWMLEYNDVEHKKVFLKGTTVLIR